MAFFWSLIERIAKNVFCLSFHIIGRQYSEYQYKTFIQFIKFGIVGLSNTIVGYGIYYVTLTVIKYYGIFSDIDYIVAQVFTFVLSVLWSFYWNNRIVFVLKDGSRRNIWKALARTYVSYSFTGLFLNGALMVLWVEVMHISEFIAPIINLLIHVPLNFLINKFWAFKPDREYK